MKWAFSRPVSGGREAKRHSVRAPDRTVGLRRPLRAGPNWRPLPHGVMGAYVSLISRIWRRLPASLRRLPAGRLYGTHVHWAVRQHAERKQWFGTFFLRNRPELELMCRLVVPIGTGSGLNVAVLACSKGAEVYSIVWALRSAHPDLKLSIHAVDISQDVLEFAERGVYSLRSTDESRPTIMATSATTTT